MKLLLLIVAAFFTFCECSAQIMEDDFETNQFNWNETVGKRGQAVIKDGVLHMETSNERLLCTTYGPFDINKPFILSCDAFVKRVDNNKIFGIILDYEDEDNFMCFYVCEGESRLEIIKNDKLVGKKYATINLESGKKKGITFEIEYNLNEIIFKVNSMKALSYRRRVTNSDFILGTSGIGFFVKNGAFVDFDNLKITQ